MGKERNRQSYLVVFVDFLGADVLIPFDSLDFSLAALFGWINFTLEALSKAENAFCKSLADFEVLTFLIKDFKFSSCFLLRAVLVLSFLTFLIADLIIGTGAILTLNLVLFKLEC